MTTKASPQLAEKVAEVFEELRRTALWKSEIPDWVNHYQKQPQTQVEFSEWLQFVFLPNKIQANRLTDLGNIAPQAAKFFANDVQRGRLLQLLVELDSLS